MPNESPLWGLGEQMREEVDNHVGKEVRMEVKKVARHIIQPIPDPVSLSAWFLLFGPPGGLVTLESVFCL